MAFFLGKPFFNKSYWNTRADAGRIRFTNTNAAIPIIILTQKPIPTRFPYSFSQNLYAIEAFTTLFDITAIRIVVAAITRVKSPDFAPVEYAILIASTSARPEISASP